MPSVDPLHPALGDILDCLLAALADHDARVCRSFIAPGLTVPWDDCCPDCGGAEGQAWVGVGPAGMFPAGPFPSQDTSPQRCAPHEYAAEVVVGVLRCAHTVDDQGHPPTAVQVTADAAKVHRDAAIVRDALLCCYAADLDPGEFRLGAWAPLGPQGGCVGGQWTATIRLPACPCP